MENLKMTDRKVKALETKKRIIETAKSLFIKKGFDHVTVDSIVEKAGVSKGAFYVHFDTKNSLIADLISDYVNKLDLDYETYLEKFPPNTKSTDILIAIAERVAYIIEFTIGYENIRFLYEVQLNKSVKTNAVLNYNRYLYKMFTDVINQGVIRGDIHGEIDVDTVAKHFIIALRGLTYEWCVRYPDFDLKSQTLKHFVLLIKGILK